MTPRDQARMLPAWPLAWIFVAFPVWWFVGLADLIWIPIAVVMVLLMGRSRQVQVPRAFGWWLLFLVLMLCSFVELKRLAYVVVFADRAAIYLSATVIFVYVYNARQHLTKRRVSAILVAYWLGIVAFGYAAVLRPRMVFTTPTYYLVDRLAPGLLRNDLVGLMFVRHLSSYNPTAYFKVSPRPSAPFLFANNWGNAYSLLLPIVIAFLIETRVRRHGWWLLALSVPLSTVPAFLTLNRGMFLGLGIAVVYAAVRLALRAHVRAIVGLGVVVLLGLVVFTLLPVKQGLAAKEQVSTTTRSSLYRQSLDAAAASPVFGYGVPIKSNDPTVPPVGTQGQVWLMLVSHGPAATVCFVGFFVVATWRSRRVRDYSDLAYHTVSGVAVLELVYYGVLPYGLPLMMVIAAVALRPRDAAGRGLPGPQAQSADGSADGSLMVVET